MHFTPLGKKGYTAWIDDQHDHLEGGVLEIHEFPTLKTARGVTGQSELLKLIEAEINKYLSFCEKTGWPPVEPDPEASAIHHLKGLHDSDAVKLAVNALQALAIECASLVGVEAAQRLAIAILATQATRNS
jgi:hypothetical protein